MTAFSIELEEAIKKATEEAIKDTSQKGKVDADLFEKEWESTKHSYEAKIQSLDETIQKQPQLQTALNQAQDLAMRAFKSTSNNAK